MAIALGGGVSEPGRSLVARKAARMLLYARRDAERSGAGGGFFIAADDDDRDEITSHGASDCTPNLVLELI